MVVVLKSLSMEIIEQLDEERINLQETILNLENQGYKEYYNSWLENIWNKSVRIVMLAGIKAVEDANE